MHKSFIIFRKSSMTRMIRQRKNLHNFRVPLQIRSPTLCLCRLPHGPPAVLPTELPTLAMRRALFFAFAPKNYCYLTETLPCVRWC